MVSESYKPKHTALPNPLGAPSQRDQQLLSEQESSPTHALRLQSGEGVHANLSPILGATKILPTNLVCDQRHSLEVRVKEFVVGRTHVVSSGIPI